MTTRYTELTPISGHTTPETAYNVEDYPYGFRLRTSIRYWVETKRGHGQRMVSQTVNPKNGRLNKPKASTYSPVVVMALDQDEHTVNAGISGYASADEIEEYALWATRHLDEYQLAALDYLRAARRAEKHLTVTAHVCQPGCTETHQTMAEGNKIISQVIAYEMRKGE